MTLIKLGVNLCAAATLLIATPGCNESDVAIGLAAVAIGVGAVAISKNKSNHRPQCRPGYRRECTDYRNYYGRRVRECREVYDRCLHYYSAQSSLLQDLGINDDETDARVIELAQNRQISFTAAETLVAALDEAAQGQTQAIFELGFRMNDLVLMANKQLPTQSSLNTLSERLDLEVTDTKNFFADILSDIEIELKDIESPFWTKCMMRGRWKTPQNNNCQKTYWSGCSPQTGASFCSAI